MSSEPARNVATVGDETSAPQSERSTDATTGLTDDRFVIPGEIEGAAGRYELLDEIAHGGMGTVLRAVDRTLGREVAVKVLQARYSAGSVIARRFIDEARISGQLQHPGIPPVHDLGSLPDGRPFLAMKLIKGRTLDALLGSRPDPAADRGRFVGVFEAVCQAVAYAHSHRVIHRDLKPSNVMVGAFGEVQVMDWGLAKVLGNAAGRQAATPDDADRALATEIRSARDTEGSETQAGSVLGTPAYMAPEQAIGAVDQVDEQSDVFGLGAILAVILTGQPPFVGDTAETTRVMAARGKVDDCFARLDASGAEPELVALCKQCLRPEPGERPASAAAVAAGVAQLRADAEERARRAELDRVRAEGERARAEAESRLQRQKRRAQLGAGAAVIGLLVILGGAWLAVRSQAAARRGDADRVASVALGRTDQLVSQAEAIDASGLADPNAAARLWEQAEAAIAQAEQSVAAIGSAGVRARVQDRAGAVRSGLARAHRDGALLAALEVARSSDRGTSGTAYDRKLSITTYEAAFNTAGLPAIGDTATLAAAVRAERAGVRQALVEALDDWATALLSQKNPDAGRLHAVLELVDPDPYRNEIRATLAKGDKAATLRLAERAEVADLPPTTASLLGYALWVTKNHAAAVRVMRLAREQHPSDLGILASLANSLTWACPDDPVAMEEAVGCARAATAVHPDKAYAYYVLGQVYHFGRDDLRAAESGYRRCLELNPHHTFCMINLGAVYSAMGDAQGEEEMFRRAVETDPGFLTARQNYANALLEGNDFAGGEAQLRKMIELFPDWGWEYRALGSVLEQRGDLDGAAKLYRRAVELLPQIASYRENEERVKRFAALRSRLDDVVAGRTTLASPAETAEAADFCRYPCLRRYAASFRLYVRAFAADPKLADDPRTYRRYNTACCAVMAGTGQGNDAPASLVERAELRRQALKWVRADLAAIAKLAFSEKSSDRRQARQLYSWWLKDRDWTGIRPGEIRFDLPAEERKKWDAFWAEVRANFSVAIKPVSTAPRTAKP
jgi:eukaryotic-like serine/threonine-protein kinase